VFDPLAIALVIAANFAFTQLRPKKNIHEKEDMKILTMILKGRIEDNEGSDIYTEEDLSVWDSTLMDGLEERRI
jgi:hypothetical protein